MLFMVKSCYFDTLVSLLAEYVRKLKEAVWKRVEIYNLRNGIQTQRAVDVGVWLLAAIRALVFDLWDNLRLINLKNHEIALATKDEVGNSDYLFRCRAMDEALGVKAVSAIASEGLRFSPGVSFRDVQNDHSYRLLKIHVLSTSQSQLDKTTHLPRRRRERSTDCVRAKLSRRLKGLVVLE